MEKKKSDNIKLNEREKFHEKLMESILKNLSDTPLVLKGGSALYLGYGLNRFSEDLDFDSLKKLNLINKIKSSVPPDIVIDDIHIKKDTDTLSRYIVNYHIQGTNIEDVLKLEVSYRTPVNEEQVVIKDGIRLLSIERIIDNKLKAAYDGENIRSRARDLFDLHFLASKYSEHFDLDLAKRLNDFAKEPDKLVSRYQYDMKFDPLLMEIMDLELVALELNEIANQIYMNKQIEKCASSTLATLTDNIPQEEKDESANQYSFKP